MTETINKIVLPIMEIFYSIQGEGFHSGTPAVFIRLSGCDVGCVWCDVKESWEVKPKQLQTIEEIVYQVKKHPTSFIVITGGEPAMYNLEPLTQELKKEGKKIAIETSGVYPIRGTFDWICFSPKKFKSPHGESYQTANELKVIIFNKSDFEWAENHRKNVSESTHLFLQPEWNKKDRLLPAIIDYIKENPHWKLSLQTHNYVNIP